MLKKIFSLFVCAMMCLISTNLVFADGTVDIHGTYSIHIGGYDWGSATDNKKAENNPSQAIKTGDTAHGEIYAMIIPISLHLKKTEIRAMAQAEDVEQVYALIRNSWYGRLDLGNLEKGQSLEEPCREVIDRIYELTSRKEPYSASVLNSYLYFKEREIEKIITTIERIRYGVAAGI